MARDDPEQVDKEKDGGWPGVRDETAGVLLWGGSHLSLSGRCFHSCCDRVCPAVWQMLSVNCPLLFPTAQALWIRRCQRLGCHQASFFSNRNPVYLQEVFQLSTLGSEAPGVLASLPYLDLL